MVPTTGRTWFTEPNTLQEENEHEHGRNARHRHYPATPPIRTEPGKGCSWSTRAPPTLSSHDRTSSRSVCGPKGRRVYELADRSEITMEITTADIEFMGETVGGTILFGEADAEPLLGVTALESVGIEVDPNNQRLKRRPAVRLKSLR